MNPIKAKVVPSHLPLRERGQTVLGLLSDPAKWCKGNLYVDQYNFATCAIPLRCEPPAKYDVLGAIMWCYEGKTREEAIRRMFSVLSSMGIGPMLRQWNDNCQSHEEMLAVVRKANI